MSQPVPKLNLQRIYLLLDSEFSPSAGSLSSLPSTSQEISSPLRNVAQEKKKKRKKIIFKLKSSQATTQASASSYETPMTTHTLGTEFEF